MARLPINGENDWGDVLNDYLLTSHNSDGTLKKEAVAAASIAQSPPPASVAAYANGLPLFNVEDYGAVGDGRTDDYNAILAAWNAMLASASGGCLFFPRPVIYRIDAGAPGRLTADSNGSYALFRLPYIARDSARLSFGVVGVGMPYSPRGDNKRAPATASMLTVGYATSFAWSEAKGLPAIFGAPDYDKAPLRGGERYTNVHFIADGIIVRQPTDPSLCAINVEACAAATIGSVAFDVTAPLDDIPEPTHATGAALLLPVKGSGAVKADAIVATGYYAGVPYTEHVHIGSAIIRRCKVAVPFRRSAVHAGHITTLTIAQCPWGFAGYDPSRGVVAVPTTCTVKVDCCDFEDDSTGAAAWTYAPAGGAHFYDPNNCLDGLIWAGRNDVDGSGRTDAMWVTGATHFSIFGLFGFTMTGSERIDASAHIPTN